ncbi:Vms1/Ankzf1 family peptidyl-tRNA hydrolase [Natrialbaceae archaeon A-arb3/5]
MFDVDELLGRASLKERIDELEEELERAEKRYEAESERRAQATTAKQEAEADVNRLEDRIAQLEGELERVQGDEAEVDYRRRDRLAGPELDDVLDRLASIRTGPEGALTAVVDDQRGSARSLDADLESVLDDRLALVDDAAPCLCYIDDAGLVSVVLGPPILPELEPTWSDRFDVDREWFLPTDRYALALVRADLFALGSYDEGDRVDYRGFESDVKGSHSKGGFSQARFERIRDDQIDDHLEQCRDALREYQRDRPADEPLYLVGQRGVVDTLVEESTLDPDATAAVDATGKPKSALEDAHDSFWTTDLRII